MTARPSAHRVVVVGAGIGGLVAGLLLAARGLDVTVLEAAAAPGGKMRPLDVDGASLDAGPTVFTMRWVFDELLQQAGSSTAAALPPLVPLGVLARHAWGDDGSGLDLHADRARSADAIAAFAGPGEGRRYLDFCREAGALYRRLEGPHLRSSRPGPLRLVRELGPRGLATLAALGPMPSLARALARRFDDPRLQQLFARYATYCGASPWLAPATLMLVAHVEQEGVWAVQGGMAALAGSLAALLVARGGRLRCGVRCRAIDGRGGRVRGVVLDDGERLEADSVVFNGDSGALPAGLLGDQMRPAAPRIAPNERSLSAVTWSMVARAEGQALVPHNVFFQSDFKSEFADIAAGRLPARGTVYVSAQDRDDAGRLPPGVAGERLLALVNAPASGDAQGAARQALDALEIESCERTSFALLQRCGLSLTRQAQVVTTPREFHRLFPGTGGAIYGRGFADRMTGGWMTLFKRPGAASPVPGLYLAGGSVHPGPGVPMAAMSGQLAAATLLAHLDSTSRSRRVVISGGMSTPSATITGTA